MFTIEWIGVCRGGCHDWMRKLHAGLSQHSYRLRWVPMGPLHFSASLWVIGSLDGFWCFQHLAIGWSAVVSVSKRAFCFPKYAVNSQRYSIAVL